MPPEPLPGPPFGEDAGGVDTRDGSALNQIAQHLLRATPLQRVLLIRNCARLAPQFETQQGIFQGVQIRVHFLLDAFHGRDRRRRGGSLGLRLRGALLCFAAFRTRRWCGFGCDFGNRLAHQQCNTYSENCRKPAE